MSKVLKVTSSYFSMVEHNIIELQKNFILLSCLNILLQILQVLVLFIFF
jgi:hypothetical protein